MYEYIAHVIGHTAIFDDFEDAKKYLVHMKGGYITCQSKQLNFLKEKPIKENTKVLYWYKTRSVYQEYDRTQ